MIWLTSRQFCTGRPQKSVVVVGPNHVDGELFQAVIDLEGGFVPDRQREMTLQFWKETEMPKKCAVIFKTYNSSSLIVDRFIKLAI